MVKIRRSRSRASGAGLTSIPATLSSGASLAGLHFLLCLLGSFISPGWSGLPRAAALSLRVCKWAGGGGRTWGEGQRPCGSGLALLLTPYLLLLLFLLPEVHLEALKWGS